MEDDERYIETMRLLVDQLNLNQESGSRADDLGVDVLEKQVDINKRRHEFDIVDREEIIYKKDGKEFVQ